MKFKIFLASLILGVFAHQGTIFCIGDDEELTSKIVEILDGDEVDTSSSSSSSISEKRENQDEVINFNLLPLELKIQILKECSYSDLKNTKNALKAEIKEKIKSKNPDNTISVPLEVRETAQEIDSQLNGIRHYLNRPINIIVCFADKIDRSRSFDFYCNGILVKHAEIIVERNTLDGHLKPAEIIIDNYRINETDLPLHITYTSRIIDERVWRNLENSGINQEAYLRLMNRLPNPELGIITIDDLLSYKDNKLPVEEIRFVEKKEPKGFDMQIEAGVSLD
ncbi:MAG: hypothetical protein Q8L85_06890 [Alphaproteobacteria bacterium]|nr:hypothetical protein [Alphaproteobacteria bacterium]